MADKWKKSQLLSPTQVKQISDVLERFNLQFIHLGACRNAAEMSACWNLDEKTAESIFAIIDDMKNLNQQQKNDASSTCGNQENISTALDFDSPNGQKELYPSTKDVPKSICIKGNAMGLKNLKNTCYMNAAIQVE